MKKLQVLLACGVAALMGSTAAHASEKTFSIGADIELDLTAKGGDLGESGRVKFNATAMSKNDAGYFVKGVGQFALGLDEADGNVGYEDVYLQAGRDSLNFQVGRFEAVSGFSAGKDTLVDHAGTIGTYEANKARGRFSASKAVHAAINGSAGAATYQLGLVKSTDDTVEGYRPAVSFKVGRASIGAVYDVLEDAGDKWKGFGLTASIPLGGGTLGGGIADGTMTGNTAGPNYDLTSTSLNYTKGAWGVGYIHSEEDHDVAGMDNESLDTLYAAYTMPLFNVKDASVTFAGSTSKADNTTGDDSLNAARVRFNYTF